MNKVSVRLSVFFDDPFWVGICEREQDGNLSACKITFGAEPKDYDVAEYVLKNWYCLGFGPPVEAGMRKDRPKNPKRFKRYAAKEMKPSGTKSQQALKLLYEEAKQVGKLRRRRQTEEEQERRFKIRQQKRKEKHKGR